MKFYSILIAFLFIASDSLSAQNFCGTTESDQRSTFFEEYHANKANFQTLSRTPEEDIFIPLTIHILQDDDGSNGYPTKTLQTSLCTLNEQFKPLNLQFYIKGEINYINNTFLNNIEDYSYNPNLKISEKRANTINVFFSSEASGNCGYYWGRIDAIVINKSCAVPNANTTWAHELGHFFSLPHPFLGWEGRDANNATAIGTIVNNTADNFEPEKVDRSNCSYTGDYLCDTDPDYFAYRWNCNSEGLSDPIKDENDIEFQADGQLYMSYSNSSCKSRFSNEQIAQMNANLNFERGDLLLNPRIFEYNDPIAAVFPINNDTTLITDSELSWNVVPQAETYEVEIAFNSSFTIRRKSYTTNTENFTIPAEDLSQRRHYWRVRPLNGFDQCTEWSDAYQFFPAETLTSVQELSYLNSFSIYPNILTSQSSLTIQINLTASKEANLLLIDLNGREISTQNLILNTGNNLIDFSSPDLAKGLYYLGFNINGNSLFKKVMIQ